MVMAQGGDVNALEDYSLLPQARFKYELKAKADGYVSKMAAEGLGICAMKLGAGREKKEDRIDLSAGIFLSKKVGEHVNKGENIATLYGNDEKRLQEVLPEAEASIKISGQKESQRRLVYGIVRKDGIEMF
jgi:pyrimidine-nucleoside phosphorylase